MNARNVAAIATAFNALLDTWHAQDASGVQQYDGPDTVFVADFLAGYGLLAPSALTEPDAWAVGACVAGWSHTSDEARHEVVDRLTRIARGDA